MSFENPELKVDPAENEEGQDNNIESSRGLKLSDFEKKGVKEARFTTASGNIYGISKNSEGNWVLEDQKKNRKLSLSEETLRSRELREGIEFYYTCDEDQQMRKTSRIEKLSFEFENS